MEVVLEGTPVREAVDNFGGTIKEAQRLLYLGFVRGKEVRSEVGEGFKKVEESLSDSVVGVV